MNINKKLIKADGLAVEYYEPEEENDPIPILFCHGTGSGSYVWSNFCEYFAGKGWHTYAMNYRGHYLSDPVENLADCQFMDYVDDVEKLIKYLGKVPYLFGHSLGGIVVQKFSERENPPKLFLIDSGTCKALTERLNVEEIRKKIFSKSCYVTKDELVGVDLTPENRESTREALKEMLFAPGMVDDEVLDEFLEKRGWESKQAALGSAMTEVDPSKVKCPVYIIGKEDGFTSGEPTNQWLAEYYNTKNVRVFEPMGHCFMKEKNWDFYAKIIEDWLRE